MFDARKRRVCLRLPLLIIVVMMVIAALFATATAGAAARTATARHVTAVPNIERLGEYSGRPVRDAVVLGPKGARTLARSALYGGTYRASSGDLVVFICPRSTYPTTPTFRLGRIYLER